MNNERPSWVPILSGAARARAADALSAIRSDLLRQPDDEPSDPSLGGGHAGIALFFAYAADIDATRVCRQAAKRYLAKACAECAVQHLAAGLYSGFTGVAWAVEHLSPVLYGAVRKSANDDIDAALVTALRGPGRGWNFDLISGLAGMGVYGAERIRHGGSKRCLELIIDRLEELGDRRRAEITWWTAPKFLGEHTRRVCPAGQYNMGMAHGVPGVISLLATAIRMGVRLRKSRQLLSGAVNWMLKRRGAWRYSKFPYFVGAGIRVEPARSAWCYGDPGISVALLAAGGAAKFPAWERTAIELALRASRRTPAQAQVVDAGLCHGAAGLAHLYNRMYQATREPVFREAATEWFMRTVDMRNPGSGIGGFRSREVGNTGQFYWACNQGFLNGAAGIGAALAAALSEREPLWDAVLLMDGARPASE